MRFVQEHIDARQPVYHAHPFFQRLKRRDPPGGVLPFVSLSFFWIMGFQDLIRLNAGLVADPDLSRVVQHHLQEDRGHDRWFLHDLELLAGSVPDAVSLFGEEHQRVRDVTYALISETFRADDDAERVTLLLAIEFATHEFFREVVGYFSSKGIASSLLFFGDVHLKAEESHEMTDEEVQAMLGSIQLDPTSRARCLALADRCGEAFVTLADTAEEAARDCPEKIREEFEKRASLLCARPPSS
jgi:hypothetical protein